MSFFFKINKVPGSCFADFACLRTTETSGVLCTHSFVSTAIYEHLHFAEHIQKQGRHRDGEQAHPEDSGAEEHGCLWRTSPVDTSVPQRVDHSHLVSQDNLSKVI